MHEVALPEAARTLPSLIKQALSGEEIVITDNEEPVAKLVSLRSVTAATPRFGSARGFIHVSDDFDEPLESFKDYMP